MLLTMMGVVKLLALHSKIIPHPIQLTTHLQLQLMLLQFISHTLLKQLITNQLNTMIWTKAIF